jgi:hypothetical protein
MRSKLALVVVVLVVALAGAGCCGAPQTQFAPVGPAAAPQACGAPQAQAVPLAMEAPVGVEFVVGPREQARAFFSMPGGWAACGAQFVGDVTMAGARALTCLGQSLVPPEPTPTQRLVYRAQLAPQYVLVPAPQQAVPFCAPAPTRVLAPQASGPCVP